VNAPRGANQRYRSLESRLEIERLTSGLEGGCWKSAQSSNSLAAYPTASPVRRGERRNVLISEQRALLLPNPNS